MAPRNKRRGRSSYPPSSLAPVRTPTASPSTTPTPTPSPSPSQSPSPPSPSPPNPTPFSPAAHALAQSVLDHAILSTAISAHHAHYLASPSCPPILSALSAAPAPRSATDWLSSGRAAPTSTSPPLPPPPPPRNAVLFSDKNVTVECYNCSTSVAASRYAQHLEKCLGRGGRVSSRAASARLKASAERAEKEALGDVVPRKVRSVGEGKEKGGGGGARSAAVGRGGGGLSGRGVGSGRGRSDGRADGRSSSRGGGRGEVRGGGRSSVERGRYG